MMHQSTGNSGSYYVYILASGHHGTLYIGMTNDLGSRLELHRCGRGSEFVKQYGVTRLVHMEEYASAQDAIHREKQLKSRKRDWKIQMIEKGKSRLERLVSPALTSGIMGPGVRRDDEIKGLIVFKNAAQQSASSAAENSTRTLAVINCCRERDRNERGPQLRSVLLLSGVYGSQNPLHDVRQSMAAP